MRSVLRDWETADGGGAGVEGGGVAGGDAGVGAGAGGAGVGVDSAAGVDAGVDADVDADAGGGAGGEERQANNINKLKNSTGENVTFFIISLLVNFNLSTF